MPTRPDYVDLFYAPGSLDDDKPPPARSRLTIAIIALPLFFIVTFVLAYIGSSHAPAPNGLELDVVGPEATTSQIQASISADNGDQFVVTTTTDAARAISRVENRETVGAVVIDSAAVGSAPTVTVVTAGAGGRLAASAVQSVGQQVADSLGAGVILEDVAPSYVEDGAGAGLFFFLILCTMGSYLSITGLYRGVSNPGRLLKLIVAGAVAVVTPVLSVLVMSASYGFFGMDVGQTFSLLGVAAVYTLTVALLSILFHELVGGAAVFLVVLVCLAFNLPTSGGSIPASMLPDFWQSVGSVWFGSGALESFQSVVYFGGHAFGEPFTRLATWLVCTALALAAAFYFKARAAKSLSSESISPAMTVTEGRN